MPISNEVLKRNIFAGFCKFIFVKIEYRTKKEANKQSREEFFRLQPIERFIVFANNLIRSQKIYGPSPYPEHSLIVKRKKND